METFLIALAGLTVIVGASVLSRRTGLAAPVLLLVLGLGASYVPGVPHIELEPEWILSGVLPPLLYASSTRVPALDFRRNLRMIGWLSIVLVVLSTLVIGFVVHLAFPSLPLALCFALGAVVSPTDAVAATSIGKRLGLPHRVMTVLEGESLVNDATALVLLRTAVAALAGSFSVWSAIGSFLYAVIAAVVVGAVVGFVTVAIRARLSDPVITTAISLAVPYIAFFPAEELDASGVLAVVVAGLVTGNRGLKRLSARDRQSSATNWATIEYLAENAVFLLMGLQLPTLVADVAGEDIGLPTMALIGLLVLGLLIAVRAVGVVLPQLSERRLPARLEQHRGRHELIEQRLAEADPSTEAEQRRYDMFRRRLAASAADADFYESERLTWRHTLVIGWAGMRGVVTLAAAQTIPTWVEHRSLVILVAFTVAVGTLVLFTPSLPPVIKKMDFAEATPEDQRSELSTLLQALVSTTSERLGPLDQLRIDGEPIDPLVAERFRQRFSALLSAGAREGDQQPTAEQLDQSRALQRLWLEELKESLDEERAIGAYDTTTLRQAQRTIDAIETRFGTA